MRTTKTAPWKQNNARKSNDPWDSFFQAEKRGKRKSSETKKRAVITQALLNRIDFNADYGLIDILFTKEFDPGSGRTLAARLTHASRTENVWVYLDILSGGRVSNTWATCLWERNSFWKRMVIPHNITGPHDLVIKDLSLKDGLAAD